MKKPFAGGAGGKAPRFRLKPPVGAVDDLHYIDSIPFATAHLGILLAFFSGVSVIPVVTCIALYLIRMFGITGVYHRYFSHRSYKTSRWFQFCLAFLAGSAAQMGPLWWASHHRHHHAHSDTEEDIHSPIAHGLWWSHFGWILAKKNKKTQIDLVPDLAIYPELRFLDKYYLLAPLTLVALLFGAGLALQTWAPQLGATAFQMVVWGFFASTVLLYHGTFCINSLAHLMGSQRFDNGDQSRNSFLLAIITLGEGWHNNHHRYPISERQGMYWWELDITHYILKTLAAFGLVWDLRTHSAKIYKEAKEGKEVRKTENQKCA